MRFQMFKKCTSLWRKTHFEVKVLKTDGFGALLEVEMLEKCTALWLEERFEIKLHKTPQPRSSFGGCDVEKVQAVVARSTFIILKSKCATHTTFGPALDIEMSKKCTPLRREAHIEVKM